MPIPPPPPPSSDKKRATISIQANEFNAWKALKLQGESWTALMRRIRTGWNDLKNITINVSGSSGGKPIERIKREVAREVPSKIKNQKAEVMKELKSVFSGVDSFKDILSPPPPEELERIKKDRLERESTKTPSLIG